MEDIKNNKNAMPDLPKAKTFTETLDVPNAVYDHASRSQKVVEPVSHIEREQHKKVEQVKPVQSPSSSGGNNVPPSNDHVQRKVPSGKRPVPKKRKDYTKQNIALVVISIIAELLIAFVMINTTQFSSFSKTMFVLINVIILLVILIYNVILMSAIRSHKKPFYVVGIIFLVLFVFIGSYGTYAIIRVNSSINKITGTTVTESVSTSLVVYSEDGSSYDITDVTQLEGKIVGYATGTNTATLGQNQIDAKGVNVSYESYQDYSSVLLALFSGDIDCAILPTNYESMFESETSLTDLIANTTSILDFQEKVTTVNESGSDKDLTSEPFTVLLIGNADGLSDTMILCSVNPISMKVTMSSIARDSYVPISCYNGGQSKLNASRSGGISCTQQTIEDLIGVDIDYYVEVNFQAVVDIVDALGGVVVDSPIAFVGQNSSDERGHYTVYVPAGEGVTLDGEQALAFARERHLFATGDFARQEHQQQVISAIIQKVMRTRDVNTFLEVLEAAGENMTTNFTVDQMTSFVSYAMQKANRYYDSEHIENIFNIQSSRVTGYSSSKWDEGSQIALYIYRLWNGSISDTREAIERNINLDSAITADTSRIKWSINWEFTTPSISSEYYAETQIPSDVPETASCGEGETLGEDGTCIAATPEPTATTITVPEHAKTWDTNGNALECEDGYELDGKGGCKAKDSTEHTHDTKGEVVVKTAATCDSTGISWVYCSENDGGYTEIITDKLTDGCSTSTPTPEVTPTPTPEVTPTPTPVPTSVPPSESPTSENGEGEGSDGTTG